MYKSVRLLSSFWSVRFLSSPYTSSEGNWNTFLQCLGTLKEETGLLDYTGDAYPIWGALQYLKEGGLSGAQKSNLLQPMQIERFLDFISKTAHVFASFFPLLCFFYLHIFIEIIMKPYHHQNLYAFLYILFYARSIITETKCFLAVFKIKKLYSPVLILFYPAHDSNLCWSARLLSSRNVYLKNLVLF